MSSAASSSFSNTNAYFFEKLHSHLTDNPIEYDVTFCVGPQKEKVNALRVILVAASPEFKILFEEKWDKAIVGDKQGNQGIPLLDFEPDDFKMFLKLLPLDPMSVSDGFIKSLGLNWNQIFSLINMCGTFGMNELKTSFEIFTADIFKNFSSFVASQEFLDLSSTVLKTILSSDNILMDEVDIFNCAYRWAEHQCTKRDQIISNVNLRQALGICVFEIRFPLMSVNDFNKKVASKSILSERETLRVYEYITLEDEDKINFDTIGLMFKHHRRDGTKAVTIGNRPDSNILSYRQIVQIFDEAFASSVPPFLCDGKWIENNRLVVNHKIELVGVVFLGPVHSDAVFDVRIMPYQRKGKCKRHSPQWLPCGLTLERVYATKLQPFTVLLDNPVVLKKGICLGIDFSLKGPETQRLAQYTNSRCVIHDEVEFVCTSWDYQMSALQFRKL